jgi:hypothetical protein
MSLQEDDSAVMFCGAPKQLHDAHRAMSQCGHCGLPPAATSNATSAFGFRYTARAPAPGAPREIISNACFITRRNPIHAFSISSTFAISIFRSLGWLFPTAGADIT